MTTEQVKFVVIGAGFGRTGTLTLKTALEILGVGPCYHMTEVFRNKHAGAWQKLAEGSDSNLLNSVLAGSGYRSSCDFPSAGFWKEQLDLYPDAKVVLTVRDPEKWYQSCLDTIFKLFPDRPGTGLGIQVGMALGLPTPGMAPMLKAAISDRVFHGDWSKENILKCYKEHNQHVIDTCPKDKLLVFEVSQGWEPLCKFLGVPVPDVPFPHVNDTAEFQGHVRGLNMMGYTVLGLAVAGFAAVAFAGVRYLRAK